ncbi:MAG: hypothetical protein ACJA08_000416 [Cyclobacteriaceae bacterium]|jgi:uncharacterized protein (DUF1015 family)
MAEIKPFRAWRYNSQLAAFINDITAPLFDVVSKKQRERLYGNPFNSIHLSVPSGENSALEAKKTLENWKKTGVILQDQLPAIYVYYQYFSLSGSEKIYCRKGFICSIKVTDWDEKMILRHESTMPFSVRDRLELLHETQLNVSPTHGLYTDSEKQIENYLDESMLSPLYEVEDYQGVRDVLSVIHDVNVIRRIQEIIQEKQIILADGHHRYEGSLKYKQDRTTENPNHTGKEAYNYHLMFLTNTESDDLRILPTHRLVKGIENFSKKWLLETLENDFSITMVENTPDINEIIQGKKWTFGLLIEGDAYKISLKPDRINTITWKFPDQIKALDLTVMHYFIFEKILGIRGQNQVNSENLIFQRNFSECMKQVLLGEVQFGLITKDISIEEVKQTCYSGYTMPQKSTYFYPKVISGFLFSSIKEDEFSSPFDTCFR